MKIKTQKSPKKKIIVLATATIVVVILFVIWLTHHYQIWPFLPAQNSQTIPNSQNDTDSTNDQQSAGEQIKAKTTDPTVSNDSNEPSVKTIVPVFITDASQYNDVIEIRSYVNEVSSTGHCSIQLEKDGSSVTKEVEVLTNAETSSCKTVDIPISEFNSDGTWIVKVLYSSDTATGESQITNVEIKR